MPAPSDALSAPKPPHRVYYSLGRMLGVEDFQADQDYHRGRLARAILQLCGSGTVCGLKVQLSDNWHPNTAYPPWSFVIDANGNVEVNAAGAGTSGATQPVWPAAGGHVVDGNITWTNEGPISATGWRPNTHFGLPSVIADPAGNLQILTAGSPLTTSPATPRWNAVTGGVTPDGGNAAAWTCIGSKDLEIRVLPGVAIDRVGRIIEVPRPVCIRIAPWLSNQSASALNQALHGSSIVIDVFATYVPCTRGVTPCFASQDDYAATDAFSPNRLLDSFAMQLVLRSDALPQLPQDPWRGAGAMSTPPNPPAKTLQQTILDATAGPASSPPFGTGTAPAEFPPGFDTSSVFLARILIPATLAPPVSGSPVQPPVADLTKITIDNLSRIFLYPASLVARWVGLSSGAES
ncbi:MAG: hypothetical protein NVS4B13_00270 [Candidatus Elarobacter sp.]